MWIQDGTDVHEPLVPYEIQDQDLGFVHCGARSSAVRYRSGLILSCVGMQVRQASAGVSLRSATRRSKFA